MNNLRVALFLAFKSLTRGNRLTLALIVFFLSLSFINLLFIAGILNGLTEAIYKQIINNFTSNIVIDPQEEPTKKSYIRHAQELRRRIEQIPGVISTVRHYKLSGTMAYDKARNGDFRYVSGQIIGIDPEEERKMTLLARNMVDGQYLETRDTDKILLGSDVAGGYGGSQEFSSLGGAKVGDKVRVTFSNGVDRTYKVKGIYKVKFGFVDRLVFVTSKEAESVLSIYNDASQILVKVDNAKASEDEYIKQIQASAPTLEVRKWIELMGDFLSFTRALNLITYMVSVIGLAVAAITLFILIYVNAVSKRRQIGILKAIGIKQNIIIWSFVFQTLFYAISGILIGSLLIFSLIAPYLNDHPLSMPIGDAGLSIERIRVIYSALSLLATGLAAGFFPAWRVTRQNILKAIWGA